MKTIFYIKCFVGLNLIGICYQSFSAGVDVKASTNHNAALTANFLRTFRPDIDLSNSKVFSLKATSSNNIFHVSLDQGREASVTIDSGQDKVVSFSAFKGFSRKQYLASGQELGEREIMNHREKTLKDLEIDTNSLKLVFANRFKLSANSKQEMIKYLWQRQTQGFPYKEDYLAITFDAQDGELLAIKQAFGPPPGSFKVKISLDDAKRIAMKHLLKTKPNPTLEVKSAKIWVVTSNIPKSPTQPSIGLRKLAWVLELTKQPEVGDLTEIWVDAETGSILSKQSALQPDLKPVASARSGG